MRTIMKIKHKEVSMEHRDRPAFVTFIGFLMTTVLSVSAILPLLLVVGISLSSEKSIELYGYQMIPNEISFEGYKSLLRNFDRIFQAYGITVAVAVCGTLYGLGIMFSYAYVLSREGFPFRKLFNIYIFIPMLFSGGLIPSYILMTNAYHLGDTFLALFVSGGVSSMYIFMMRSYLVTSVPREVVESAKVDGAGEMTCLLQIVLPMAKPSIATIGLFLVVGFWNDWYTGFLYIVENNAIVPISLLIQRIEKDINFLENNKSFLSASMLEGYKSTIPTDGYRMGLVIIAIIPMLIAYPFFQRYFVKGVTVGAIKG